MKAERKKRAKLEAGPDYESAVMVGRGLAVRLLEQVEDLPAADALGREPNWTDVATVAELNKRIADAVLFLEQLNARGLGK